MPVPVIVRARVTVTYLGNYKHLPILGQSCQIEYLPCPAQVIIVPKESTQSVFSSIARYSWRHSSLAMQSSCILVLSTSHQI